MHDSEERYPPPLCHPGTREVVICRIEGWYGFEKPPKKRIMWVHGPAGYGKTAVAGTVSKKMEARTMDLGFNPVGATFFFWRTSPERSNPARFIITLAYQFTMSIPELAPHIDAAVKQNPMILNKTLEVQLMKLIVEPFKYLGELDNMPHMLVIVDGLDECINSDQESRVERQYAEDQERVQIRLLELIRTLQSHNLPLCFLIFSRPEPWIKRQFDSRFFRLATEVLDLYEVGDHLKDVERFVRDELARIAENSDLLPDDEEWPGGGLFERFVQRTEGHMLYAATVIRHIDDPYDDPRQRLRDVLNTEFDSAPELTHSTPFSLHELYRQIVCSCPRANWATMVEVLEEILAVPHYLFTVEIHLALNILDRLSGRAPGRGMKAIRPLHAVIRLSNKDEGSHNNPAFFYHSSFTESLRAGSPLLPDVTLNVQRGVNRLLAGCFKSLSAIDMEGQANEEHVDVALDYWPLLWLQWNPDEDPDPSSLLEALLRVDFTTCFVQVMTGPRIPASVILWACLDYLYHPTQNLIVSRMPDMVGTPLVEEALLHLRSSVEGAFLRILDPDYLSRFPHRDTLSLIQFTRPFFTFMVQTRETSSILIRQCCLGFEASF
jgi:hypothetical protein